MEKLIILTGTLVGTMRVRTQKQGTEVEVLLRKGHVNGCTAYLVDGLNGLCAVELNASLKGGINRPFDVHAVLLVVDTPRGPEFMAEGGFIGRAKMLEQAKRDIRILRTGLAPHRAAEAPSAAAEVETAKSSSVVQKNTADENTPTKSLVGPIEEIGKSEEAARLYNAGSAADAVHEQTRLTKEYAGAVRAGEVSAHEGASEGGAFRPPEGTRENSRALDEILKKADELFRPLDVQLAANNPQPAAENTVYNPFPDAFPASRWKKVNYPGTNRFYLEGEMEQNGIRMVLHALPGEYAPVPPMRRRGFTRFFRAMHGNGYWVRVQKR